ncbi:glycoside hydrolase family 16 protein [Mariniluteicoccus flavus]
MKEEQHASIDHENEDGTALSRRALLAGTGALGLTLAGGGLAAAAPSAQAATAGELLDWGTPVWSDDFTAGSIDPNKWAVYSGPGHAGNGRRLPELVGPWNGHLRITGLPNGDSGGLSMKFSQKYGRWEARARMWQETSNAQPYHPVLLLWPDSEKWPDDGEYDFAETNNGSSSMGAFLHYPNGTPAGGQVEFHQAVDIASWHNYAIEWAPDHISGYIDGVEWFRTTDPKVQAPGPMHATAQLDNFHGGQTHNKGYLDVDWYRVWTL